MKTLLFFPFLFLIVLVTWNSKSDIPVIAKNTVETHKSQSHFALDLQGAWTSSEINEAGEKITITTIVMDGFLAETYYEAKSGAFIRSFGGYWTVDKNVFSLTIEFSSSDSTEVGTSRDVVFELKGDTITFDNSNKIWTRLDAGQEGDLNGAWLITGRKRDGNMVRRTPGDRKTMKILSSTRFQWIAFNTATGKFSGTGGGSYTAKNGTYTENIEFFSRDNSRVGAELSFQYEVIENEWHHSGLSSKGSPIYEIWSPRILSPKTMK